MGIPRPSTTLVAPVGLRDPVGKDLNFLVWLGLVVGNEVQAEVMRAAHVAVHEVFQGNYGAFAGLDGHRTDDRGRRSTPCSYFDVRGFGEPQGLIAYIGNAHFVAHQRS